MTLFEQVKAVYLEKRKARETEAVASLSTLIGEIETLAKSGRGETTDAVVITMVKKFIKNIQETLALTVDHNTSMHLIAEKMLYEQFLPKQLSHEDLALVIDGIIAAGNVNVGDAMKSLKASHGGMYDGAKASQILKGRFA